MPRRNALAEGLDFARTMVAEATRHHPQLTCYKSTVRTPMLLEAQMAEARERIHEAILTGATKYRTEEGIAIAIPAVMATATKA